MEMEDLNDLRYFGAVVAHGGFAPAGRALRIPKSKLSRRIAALEARLGVRLIERSTRRFRVTELGAAFHEQCLVAVAAAERAEAIVEASLTEPRGLVCFACPTGLVAIIAPMLADFLTLYPKARVQIVAQDRPVDLIAERIDVALRVRTSLDTDAGLVMRTLAQSRRILVAGPALANRLAGQPVAALASFPTLSSSGDDGEVRWELEGPDGAGHVVTHLPRLSCGDFQAIKAAAIDGLGVALLPDHVCAPELRSGALVRVYPEWGSQQGIVHLVFTTRVGLPPLVRAWIDHLAARFRDPALMTG
jgi:DNA-binding transcriptional LysR family regulator